MDVFTLEAGRAIRRNGRPFVSISGCSRDLPGYAPADFDTFARAVVAMLEALPECVELLDRSDVRYFISTKLGEQARLHSALNKSRAALAQLPRAED